MSTILPLIQTLNAFKKNHVMKKKSLLESVTSILKKKYYKVDVHFIREEHIFSYLLQ